MSDHGLYTLLSGVAQNAKNPNTFAVPEDTERRRLRPGDFAKLLFSSTTYPGLDEVSPWVERMWVEVDHIDYPNFRGRLANEPFAADAFGLSAGDPVVFHARHIIDAMPNEAAG